MGNKTSSIDRMTLDIDTSKVTLLVPEYLDIKISSNIIELCLKNKVYITYIIIITYIIVITYHHHHLSSSSSSLIIIITYNHHIVIFIIIIYNYFWLVPINTRSKVIQLLNAAQAIYRSISWEAIRSIYSAVKVSSLSSLSQLLSSYHHHHHYDLHKYHTSSSSPSHHYPVSL